MSSKPAERFMPEGVKSWQYAAWALIESNAWELTMTCLILLNIFALLIEVNIMSFFFFFYYYCYKSVTIYCASCCSLFIYFSMKMNPITING